MKFYVYILYSESLNRFYTGFSKFHAKRRRQHVKGQSKWTSQADDWGEVWFTELDTAMEARRIEKKIKARGARRYLEDLGVAVPRSAG